MFHLFTHAFFKALLFLGAGSVIHAVHSNNMSDMGGLRKHMPVTFWTFLIGSLALAGVPPFAGFFSKDEIILAAKDQHTYWLFAVLLIGAVITAFYTTRMVLQDLLRRVPRHASTCTSRRASMTAPLVVLAVATVLRRAPRVRRRSARRSSTGCTSGRPRRAVFSPARGRWSRSWPSRSASARLGTDVPQRTASPTRSSSSGGFSNLLEHKYYLDDFYFERHRPADPRHVVGRRLLVQPERARRRR